MASGFVGVAQQDVDCSSAAITACCGTEGQYLVVQSQPIVDLLFQNRLLRGGAIAFAVNDEGAADTATYALGEEFGQEQACLLAL